MILSIGTRVRHAQYGEGLIIGTQDSFYHIAFPNYGEKAIDHQYEGLEIIELAGEKISLGDLETVLRQNLQKWMGVSAPIDLGSKWKEGTMSLHPSNPDLKAKEIPIETFFHKIVMMRDRLRVLEQNINKNKNLSDEEKVNLQQYITRIYGSMTSFNVLFSDPNDGFKGEGKK